MIYLIQISEMRVLFTIYKVNFNYFGHKLFIPHISLILGRVKHWVRDYREIGKSRIRGTLSEKYEDPSGFGSGTESRA